MSGVSLVTKGMICQINTIVGGGQSAAPYIETSSMPIIPTINVTKVKTRITKPGIDLNKIHDIVFNVNKVLSSEG